ncbi:hypothetical protein FNH22_09530 [Fulvivirga sp. M361]|uniref:retropepsin-like aspartic protease n=1 Tax=Fulvivirga sp. M361 TaxID=2594266 RepID=UPI00117A2618|nr:retropepsin-like aspartic protease [Fulvivirga sp. M361]TRX59398.1 hypothetical protein FNH22_09530 [Fulvivirga sp. M361]
MLNSNNNWQRPSQVRYALIMLSFLLQQFSFADDYKGFELINDKQESFINFRLINNLIVVPVKINNKMELNLVLDTGGRSVILFGNHFKRKFELLPKEIVLNGYGRNRHKTARLSLDNQVEFGDALGKGISILIANDKYFFPYNDEVVIHGIIGYQVFSRFAVTIDYKQEVITLTEPGYYLPPSGYKSMELTLKDTKPYIKLDYGITPDNSANGFFHIDTGSSRNVILFMKDDTNYFKGVKKLRCEVGKGINGSIAGYKDVNNLLELKNLAVRTDYHMLKREFSSSEINNAEGSIGSGLWKEFTIVLDYVNQMFYYRKVT